MYVTNREDDLERLRFWDWSDEENYEEVNKLSLELLHVDLGELEELAFTNFVMYKELFYKAYSRLLVEEFGYRDCYCGWCNRCLL